VVLISPQLNGPFCSWIHIMLTSKSPLAIWIPCDGD